jgi:hypothetical protein
LPQDRLTGGVALLFNSPPAKFALRVLFAVAIWGVFSAFINPDVLHRAGWHLLAATFPPWLRLLVWAPVLVAFWLDIGAFVFVLFVFSGIAATFVGIVVLFLSVLLGMRMSDQQLMGIILVFMWPIAFCAMAVWMLPAEHGKRFGELFARIGQHPYLNLAGFVIGVAGLILAIVQMVQ